MEEKSSNSQLNDSKSSKSEKTEKNSKKDETKVEVPILPELGLKSEAEDQSKVNEEGGMEMLLDSSRPLKMNHDISVDSTEIF